MNLVPEEEWLDIVDLEDRVVGRDTRRRIHEQEQMHRASHIMLFHPQGAVFVQQRSFSKDSGPGLWDSSVAGHVDSGESYLECAVRELQEEVGIVVDPLELRWIDKLAPEARNGFEFTAIYCVCSDQSVQTNPDEIIDGRWLLPTELDEWIDDNPEHFTEVFRFIWPMARAHQVG